MSRNYPSPAGEPGAPFADANFKLVVLEDLMSKGVIQLGESQDLAKFVLGREVDLEAEFDGIEQDIFPAIHAYLARYPITEEQLGSVTEVVCDGGLEIYQLAWYVWDGESEEFDIQSMAGIERCVNLKRFVECSMLKHCDLALLKALPQLEAVELMGEASYENVEALLEMPALRRLTLRSTTLGEPGNGILKLLATKGVAIKVH